MVYEKTEAESKIQFDEDLDEYMRNEMSENARSWARVVMFQKIFDECKTRDIEGDEDKYGNTINRVDRRVEKLQETIKTLMTRL